MTTIGSNENKLRNLLSPEELAAFLGISKVTVYRWVEDRKLPFHKLGGRVRFRMDDIEKYLDRNRCEPIST